MRLGMFTAILVALLVIASFYVPVTGTVELLAGGSSPSPGSPARCLVLPQPSGPPHHWWPDTIRLLPQVSVSYAGRTWYRAQTKPGRSPYLDAVWRPAGRDSIDIAWHHSQILRLPNYGDTLVGRADWPSYPNFLTAILTPKPAVLAVTTSCP